MLFFNQFSRLNKCGFFLNIHLIMFCSIAVSDIKPMVLPVDFDTVRWIPSCCRMFLPMTFRGRFFNSSILQFSAVQDPDLRVTYKTLFIWMSGLLKPLYFVFSVKVVILVEGCLDTLSFAWMILVSLYLLTSQFWCCKTFWFKTKILHLCLCWEIRCLSL